MSDLAVFVDGLFAGRVAAATSRFEYEPEYLQAPHRTPLSLRAPLVRGSAEMGAWLDGLLPDNDEVRRRWAIRYEAATAQPVDLLSTRVGLDCAGAAQFCPMDEADQMGERPSGIEWLTDDEIEGWIKRARLDWSRWHGLGHLGQVSLGGAQAKCALVFDGRRWGAAYGNTATTHILKPGLEHLAAAEVLEHVCMAAASTLGLEVAGTRVCHFGDERVVAVERFDRVTVTGETRRLHHEDLCQALGVPSTRKYQSDGGPGPVDVARLLRAESSSWRSDLLRFRDALIFNWAIAAADAHAKNYSLLLDSGHIRLAPLYDVMSFLPYMESTPVGEMRTAMKTGSNYTLNAADQPSAWRHLSSELGLDPDETDRRVEELVSGLRDAVTAAIDGLEPQDRLDAPVVELERSLAARVAALQRRGSGAAAVSRAGSARSAVPLEDGKTRQRAVRCGQVIDPVARTSCRRRLLTRPCPLHPDSPGSRRIKRR